MSNNLHSNFIEYSNVELHISGGFNGESKSECHIFESCTWKHFSSLKNKRRFGTLTTTANSSPFIIGGEESSKKQLNSVEKLVNNEWIEMKSLTKTVSRHCAVSVKEDIYLIGGHIGSDQFSDQVITLDTISNESKFLRSKLNKGRQFHSCAKINSKNIIVVGGRNLKGSLKSVELLSLISWKWSEPKELELPVGISYAEIVNPPTGDTPLFELLLVTVELLIIFK